MLLLRMTLRNKERRPAPILHRSRRPSRTEPTALADAAGLDQRLRIPAATESVRRTHHINTARLARGLAHAQKIDATWAVLFRKARFFS